MMDHLLSKALQRYYIMLIIINPNGLQCTTPNMFYNVIHYQLVMKLMIMILL